MSRFTLCSLVVLMLVLQGCPKKQDGIRAVEQNATLENNIASSEGSGKVYALLVGVNRYIDPKIPTLKYTHRDVRGLYQALTVRWTPLSRPKSPKNK